jgi:hypothetical protein
MNFRLRGLPRRGLDLVLELGVTVDGDAIPIDDALRIDIDLDDLGFTSGGGGLPIGMSMLTA